MIWHVPLWCSGRPVLQPYLFLLVLGAFAFSLFFSKSNTCSLNWGHMINLASQSNSKCGHERKKNNKKKLVGFSNCASPGGRGRDMRQKLCELKCRCSENNEKLVTAVWRLEHGQQFDAVVCRQFKPTGDWTLCGVCMFSPCLRDFCLGLPGTFGMLTCT